MTDATRASKLIASRLCDEAKPRQILISPRVLMKVEQAVTVEPVGEFKLKSGVPRGVQCGRRLLLFKTRSAWRGRLLSYLRERPLYACDYWSLSKLGANPSRLRQMVNGTRPFLFNLIKQPQMHLRSTWNCSCGIEMRIV